MTPPQDVSIEWVASALAQLPRWLGRARKTAGGPPLSVAQHSAWCAEVLSDPDFPVAEGKDRAATAMAALLHDGHEAWIGDLPAPLKPAAGLDAVERGIDLAVERASGLPEGWERLADRRAVKAADAAAAALEAKWFGGRIGIGGIEDSCAERAREVWAECGAETAAFLEKRLAEGGPPEILGPAEAETLFLRGRKRILRLAKSAGKRSYRPIRNHSPTDGKIMTQSAFPQLFGDLPPLHDICLRKPEEADAFLETGGADPDQPAGGAGARPLHLAAASPLPRAKAAVEALLRHGADPRAADAGGAPPAFWAARWGTLDTLIAIGPDRIDFAASDDGGRGIAHWWAMGDPERGAETEEFLKDCGADFAEADEIGAAPAHWAAALGGRMRRLLELFPAAGALPDRNGYPPIFYAAGAGLSLEAVPHLIRGGFGEDSKAGGLSPGDVAADPESWRKAVEEAKEGASAPAP